MPRAFDTTKAGRVNLDLPLITKQQLAALNARHRRSARDIVAEAIADMWRREIGEPPPWQAELDELRERIARLEQEQANS